MDKKVRTRLAPSPTGPMHIGTVRTALYNYLFAKQHGGAFVLRIEDTDKERSRPEFEKAILEGLRWSGLAWDEGPMFKGEKGDFRPYRQSQRSKIYQEYIEQLLLKDWAYWCMCKPDDLEKERKGQVAKGLPPRYSGRCKKLSKKERETMRQDADHAVIRFNVPAKQVEINDLVRGQVNFDTSLFDDFIIAKDTDKPLYNLAAVIDDHLMKISHVIRGEEHLSNTPKQVLLAEALGFDPPQYAHIPLILNPDRTKMSKRKGEVGVTLKHYIKQGYLPEALINFLALLGWNPGGGSEEEIFSLEQLFKKFNLQKVHKGGAVFNLERLDWINGHYIRQLKTDELADKALPYLKKAGLPNLNDKEYVKKVVILEQDRIKKLSEIGEYVDFFFKEIDYPKDLLIARKSDLSETKKALEIAAKALKELGNADFTAKKLDPFLRKLADNNGLPAGVVLWTIRAAITGKKASPSTFDCLAVLGKEKSLARISAALAKLS